MFLFSALIEVVYSFLFSIIPLLIKWFSRIFPIFAIQKIIQGVFISIILAFFAFVATVVNYIYGLTKDFIDSYNNYNVSAVAGSNDFGHIFLGVLDASGVGLAFETIVNLYIAGFLILLAFFLWRQYFKVQSKLYQVINDGLELLAS